MKQVIVILLFFLGVSVYAQQDSLKGIVISKKEMLHENKTFKVDETIQSKEVEMNYTKAMYGEVVSKPEQSQFVPQVYESGKEEIFIKRLRGPSQYDSRIEIAQLDPDVPWQLSIRNISESVAMVVERSNLIKISPTTYQLNVATSLGNRYNLCHDQAFFNQRVVGVGTAFITDKKQMITAAHVFPGPLKDYAIVFGYHVINQLGTAETSIDAKNVYYPDKIIKRYDDLDLVVFETDRELNRPVLAWEKSAALHNGNEIYMLGYPMGLPEKLAINADITDNANRYFFYTSLDSFQGNSGSPIFNFETHKIIGVLVSGMVDYELHGDCYRTTSCRQPDCVGEKAIRIELAFSP